MLLYSITRREGVEALVSRFFTGRVVYFSLMTLLLIALIVAVGCSAKAVGKRDLARHANERPESFAVVLNGRTFILELAFDDEQRARGLMGRTYIAENGGMFFVYPATTPYPTELLFWMKNCSTGIDVIFISRDGFITAIHEMELPLPGTPDHKLPQYSSVKPAQFAVELRGGTTRELNLNVGDFVELDYDYLLQWAQ